MKTLEEIAYDAGRQALAAQESLVNGIRQRTGTLLAAHALVASFLGTAAIRGGLHVWGWLAIVSLVVALVIAATLLAPWNLSFAVDAQNLYAQLHDQARRDAIAESSAWLVAAGLGYQQLRDMNASRVRIMSGLSGVLAMLMVLQTLTWIAELVR